uniref:Uncharacterized protein n=1 Tax=Siphoviridae sp. ctn8e14 TaxID=2827936 RepID=A0A8S5T5Z9_9CAUD|nr:MAG TPA: hypothetical protein [Siphoviridae sp. ctn8e14]
MYIKIATRLPVAGCHFMRPYFYHFVIFSSINMHTVQPKIPF